MHTDTKPNKPILYTYFGATLYKSTLQWLAHNKHLNDFAFSFSTPYLSFQICKLGTVRPGAQS